MASSDPRDPMYGQPYTGTPVQQQPRGGRQTVFDFMRSAPITIETAIDDNHYTPDGNLYHE